MVAALRPLRVTAAVTAWLVSAAGVLIAARISGRYSSSCLSKRAGAKEFGHARHEQ